MLRAFFCFVLLLFAARALAADNWPQFRGPGGDGMSDAKGLPLEWAEGKNVRWKTPIHGKGWSSPVIWGDKIWLTTATPDGKEMFAICVDRESGKVLHGLKMWDVESPGFCPEMNSYASCTPVIEEGRVYVHFGSYGTACLNSETGEVLWQRRDLPCDHFRAPASSPILFENLLILQFDGFDHQYVAALDKNSGEDVWRSDRKLTYEKDDGDIKKAFSTPQVIEAAGALQLISPSAAATQAFDVRTGKEIWRVQHGGMNAAARPLFFNGRVFVNSGYGGERLLAVRPDGQGDVTATHVDWKFAKSVPTRPSHLIADGLMFMVSDQGVATCLNANSGDEVWTDRLTGDYSASPICAEGRIYFCDEKGVTRVISAGPEFELLAENKLDEGCMASPAVAGKAIYLRTRTHLYRVEE